MKSSTLEARLLQWILNDELRMKALKAAATYQQRDWCLAAGFVRNLAWDHFHHYTQPTPLNDIDFIYFNPNQTDESFDKTLELKLTQNTGLPWSVKNQSRMHIRNGDRAYVSTSHAMTHWPELETAIGVRLTPQQIQWVAPLGVESLFNGSITFNRKTSKRTDFYQRIETKNWLKLWPKLTVQDKSA